MQNGAQSKGRSREGIKSSKKSQEIGRISNIYRNALKDLVTKSVIFHSNKLINNLCQSDISD